jgi:hypothetical protein
MKKLLPIIVISFLIIGCKTTEKARVLHYDYFVRNAEIEEPKITRSALVCDMNIDFTKRVMGTSKEHYGDDRAEKAKEEAYFNALVNNNIDVLVSPIYQIEQSDKTASAIVYGFAGMYINARPKAKALEEVQNIDSTAFYKYELVWEGAKIAPGQDIILHRKGEAICPNCPNQKITSKKSKDSQETTSSAISPTVVYSEENIVYNPYGPGLVYTNNYTHTRKEKSLEPFKPKPSEVEQPKKRKGAGLIGGIIGVILTVIIYQASN